MERKVNLKNYGGLTYESVMIGVEDCKSMEEAKKCVRTEMYKYIQEIEDENIKLARAVTDQKELLGDLPFIEKDGKIIT